MRTSTWIRRNLTAMLAAGLLVGVGACSDDGGDDSGDDNNGTEPSGDGEDDGDDGSSSAGEITISGFAFEGATVAAGTTVTVTNADSTAHTVTSDDEAWEEANVSGGSEGEIIAPTDAGSYDFHCAIHSSMTGTLVVE